MKMPLSPLKTIRAHCRQCLGDDRKAIRECPTISCACHPYRMGKIPLDASGRLLSVIHTHCLNCVGTAQAVRACSAPPEVETNGYPPCHLHSYRLGRRPNVSEAVRERGKILAQKNFKRPNLDSGMGEPLSVPPTPKKRLPLVLKKSEGGPCDEHED
jgi:hypothetical protein